jgi:acyl-CoA dehydrogenase
VSHYALFDPTTFDPAELDGDSRRQLRALIEWFENRGKARLLAAPSG